MTRKHKPEIQKLYDELEECGTRLMEYKDCFEVMGKDLNSYSKTDLEATFMRMKEETVPRRTRILKSPNSVGLSLPYMSGVKNRH